MRVLLVEDEEHKIQHLTECVIEEFGAEGLRTVKSVRDAVRAVYDTDFDLIILDMALPTFAVAETSDGGGFAQAVGGVEVLRAMNETQRRCNVVVVTQYHDILINGEQIALKDVPRKIRDRYDIKVLGAVLYSYASPSWRTNFIALLRSAK